MTVPMVTKTDFGFGEEYEIDDRIIAAIPIPSTPVPVSALAPKTVSAVQALENYCTATIEGTRPGIELGIPAIDRATRGIQPGEFWTDIGRTASLKTMAYCNRMLGLCERYPDAAWLICNMEMPAHQTVERLARMHLGVTHRELEERVKAGHPSLADVASVLAGLHFLDEGAVTLQALESAATVLAQSVPPRRLAGIVVDHAGLVRPERGAGSGAYERATATAVGLKQLARRLDLIVFAVVQANRAGKADEGAPVALESARDSGAFEENSDYALTYSGIVPARNGQLPWIKCRLAKNRRGPELNVSLAFDPRTLRMRELEDGRGA